MSRAQRKAEELKRRKEKRKKEWARLMKEKPDQRYENPQPRDPHISHTLYES